MSPSENDLLCPVRSERMRVQTVLQRTPGE